MRLLLGLVLALLVGAAEARFPRGTPTQQILYNIVTDGGANCNGVADTAPNFKTFNTWALANQGTKQVVLTIPNGSTCLFNSSQSYANGISNAWASGINNLIVEGTGATITSVGGQGFTLGGKGVCQKGLTDAAGCSARINSVSPGATTVTLTSASFAAGYISRFTVNKWIMLGGLDIQGLWNAPYGFPPNNQFFEWRQITAVNTGTGVITLDRPVTNSYLSTWPNYNGGNNVEADQGGPATIWTVDDTWNAVHEYRGLTMSQSGQINGNLRNLTLRGVTFTGTGGGNIPSQNESWAAVNTNYGSNSMEVDKLIGTMTMDNVTIAGIQFQSSSVDQFFLKNSTVTTMSGSPKKSDITDVSIGSLKLGAVAYGVSDGYFNCLRCAVTTFDYQGGGIFQNDNPAVTSMASGVISFANTAETGAQPPGRIYVPNTNVSFAAPGYLSTGIFRVTGITQDPTNVYVQTNQAGGFPTIGSPIQYRTQPIPAFTCDACTGDPILVAMGVQAGATPGAPLNTYSFRSYAPTSAQGLLGTLSAQGKIVSLTIDVTQAYTGSGAATLQVGGQFNNLVTVNQATWTNFTFAPQINLKQAGTRVITPSGVTCNGVSAPTGCSGDSLGTALPNAVWIQTNLTPYMGSTLSGGVNPLFTMTIRTDQTP